MNSNFRYDINGLRAYAVALVVLFHFGVAGFTGGFIGVDVFFVISGFLMTKIILTSLERNTFHFLEFYISRANRIIPALVALIITINIIAWFTLLPNEYKNFAKHAIESLKFTSNIQYFNESGYFDTISHQKILLHTWSLSIEWQFYIILPLFLYLVLKIFKKINALKIAYGFIFIFSLSLSIYLSKNHASASFYLLHTRAWEMMGGGLIFLFFNNISIEESKKKLLELIGFTLIFLSLAFFSGVTSWPSYNAILPVLGSILILLANNTNSIFTKNRIVQFIGNSSYSIYLWHWPIVFYLAYIEKSQDNLFIFGAIILSILLGWLSYKFIEIPSRKWLSELSLLKNYFATIIYLFLTLAMLNVIFSSKGFPERLSNITKKIAVEGSKKSTSFAKCHVTSGTNLPECKNGKGEIKLLVIGDSHAAAMMDAVTNSLPPNTASIDLTYSGCPTVENIKKVNSPNFRCSYAVTHFLMKTKEYPNAKILIINRTNSLFHGAADGDITINKPVRYTDIPFERYDRKYYSTMKEAYIRTLCKFAENNTVYVTRPVPEYPVNVPHALGKRAMIGSNKRITVTKHDYLERSKLAFEAQNEASKVCGIHILDTTKYFCNTKECFSDLNGIPLYFDDDHLNTYGANLLIPMFKEIWN
ncbi:acyltransferase family protein [Acinetobacter junii]|uniref:acyltransferase family protein n=1 Tax=Acinetobacter junii TaxID=40215 RepID=UPI00143AF010|nr:acyltransferase family protein [Acinetobacter junii]NKG35997.1 acyltransferase [Acinetobacter junii]